MNKSEQLSLSSKYHVDSPTPEFNLQGLNLTKLALGAHQQEQIKCKLDHCSIKFLKLLYLQMKF